MNDAPTIIRNWCAAAGMPEPSDGECHALSVALATQAQQALPVAQGDAGDAARSLFDAGWKACAKFCDRDDVRYDGIVGSTGCPEFETAFDTAIAAYKEVKR